MYFANTLFGLLSLGAITGLVQAGALSTCSVNPAKHPLVLCNKAGILKNPAPLGGTISASSAADCYGACKLQLGCKSFGFVSSDNTCQLYSQPLKIMGFTAKTSNPTATYYNHKCFVTHCPKCNVPSPAPVFLLQASGTGTSYDGNYVVLVPNGDGSTFDATLDIIDNATPFTYDSQCHLSSQSGELLNFSSGIQYNPWFFNLASDPILGSLAVCNPSKTQLKCSVGVQHGYKLCGSYISFARHPLKAPKNICVPLVLNIVTPP